MNSFVHYSYYVQLQIDFALLDCVSEYYNSQRSTCQLYKFFIFLQFMMMSHSPIRCETSLFHFLKNTDRRNALDGSFGTYRVHQKDLTHLKI